ncbi:hypothetical protein BH11PLA1_BH11PLA1_24390 [soil metagenome]
MPVRLLVSAAAIAATALAASARADTTNVYVFNYNFSTNQSGEPIVAPTIILGDTIRWVFLDSGHSATSVNGSLEEFDSGYIGIANETFEHTFTHAGVFWYYCFPHGNDVGNGTASGMSGTITVVPTPGAALLFAAGITLARRRRS